MLKKVGVNWEPEFLEPAVRMDRLKNLNFELSRFYVPWLWDPDINLTAFYHPDGFLNVGRTNNKKVIKLIMAGRKEVNVLKRQKIYHKIEKELYNNYMEVWVWWSMSVRVYRKNVHGYNEKMYLKDREGYWFPHPMWFKDGKP